MQLRSRVTLTPVAPSRSATTRARQDKRTVPSRISRDGATDHALRERNTNLHGAQAHAPSPCKPNRSATPKAFNLATISSEHVTPRSAPTSSPTSTSDRVQALAVLQKIMGRRLPPDELSNYEVMVSNLARRGWNETGIRNRYHSALRDLFEKHRHAAPVHNKFAQMYNRHFEGQDESFHLPVYEDLESGSEVKGEVKLKQEALALAQPQDRSIHRTESYHATTSPQAALHMQFDGTMDEHPNQEPQATRTDADLGPFSAGNLQYQMDEMRNDSRAAEDDGDVEMRDADGHLPSLEAVREHIAQMRDHRNSNETKESIATGPPRRLEESVSPEHQPTSKDRVELALLVSTEPKETDAVTEGGGEPTQQPDTRKGNCSDIALDCHDTSKAKDDSNESDNEDDSQHTTSSPIASPPPSIAPSLPPHFPKPESTRSYLAWLHHRQARFPTAAPNFPECILVAKKLGCHPSKVFDEVTYHWGFETGCDRSEWYKHNRLTVLGEDPRFDEEGVGRWRAWLELGRDGR
ncbi:hypothetical protein CC86DRAFT_402332 [Ophiobolus disseminans]|uniref:Uncharacterized protein n=1 Tax=Ophiobolus disseminans TaxID=1469910 RepID=A0A6A7AC88_9PLEO|nr:hypothetical protein CC86DRAFT_402332 [Ophiobolus disseminans]